MPLWSLLFGLALAGSSPSTVQKRCAVARAFGTVGMVTGGVGLASSMGILVRTQDAGHLGGDNALYATTLAVGGVSVAATIGGFVSRPGCVRSGRGRLLGPALLITSLGVQLGGFGALVVTEPSGSVDDFLEQLAGGGMTVAGTGLTVTGLALSSVAIGGLRVRPYAGRRPGLSVSGRW